MKEMVMKNFYINNDSDLEQNLINAKESAFTNVNNTIVMDSDNDVITGISSPTSFNWYFLRLVDGVNTITTDSENDIKISFVYREPRRVIV